ncbi:MAG: invasion associated locus B family protein [Methylocystis sp.]
MSIKFLRSSAAALALFAGGAAVAQQAQPPAAGAAPLQPPQQQQQQQPQGPVKADLVPVQPEWTKVCGGDPQSQKEVCYTTRDFGLQADQPILALAVYDPKGAPEKVIRLLLPPGLLLKPGFRFSIDKGPQETGAFEICFPNGCFAEAKVKPAIVDSMKKAEKLSVVVKNQVNNEVTFVLPLAAFGKAFDGPAIDPKVLEERQKKLQEDMEKKAAEERNKLDASKGGAAAPAGKAPAGK